MLILAATPIGNLSDASPRLVEALRESRFIAAEDTRTLLKLANGLGVKLNATLFSLHEHNESDRVAKILDIATENDVLVVSDAGMPTISDPGFVLVRAAIEADIAVSVIPGPSAVLAALSVSGLPTDRFTFEGFLPRKNGERTSAFENLSSETRTMVFFESPHRLTDSLESAAKVFGNDRLASVSRELTKKFEETKRGTLESLVEWSKSEPKGEMVLVIAGFTSNEEVNLADLVESVEKLRTSGLSLKQSVAEVASANGVGKSELYKEVLDARTNSPK